jgi:hypothetical protein
VYSSGQHKSKFSFLRQIFKDVDENKLEVNDYCTSDYGMSQDVVRILFMQSVETIEFCYDLTP